jgi:hypothetical protein
MDGHLNLAACREILNTYIGEIEELENLGSMEAKKNLRCHEPIKVLDRRMCSLV